MVVCGHTGVMCTYCFIGETPDKEGALERCFPVGFYRGIDSHSGFVCSQSGCVCPHSGYVCCIIGEIPYRLGTVESCFPVGFYSVIDPHRLLTQWLFVL